jgi:hypothetical protein
MGHVACTQEMRNEMRSAYKILVVKPRGKTEVQMK